MHQEEYKGRSITVDTYERKNGWTWSYQIDESPLNECRDRPLASQQLALSEALHEAKIKIDNANK